MTIKRIKQPATGRLFALSARCCSKGFTLLEVLAVMVIIGIMLTFVTLSPGGDRRAEEMQREAQRLVALLQLASEESLMRSEQLALRINETDYAFMILTNGRWLLLDDDRPLRPREMPAGIELHLELQENQPSGLAAEEGKESPGLATKESEQPPQVLLMSSGEITPFELTLSAEETEQRYVITATLLGKLKLE